MEREDLARKHCIKIIRTIHGVMIKCIFIPHPIGAHEYAKLMQ